MTGVPSLADRFGAISSTWLDPAAPAAATLRRLLDTAAAPAWPDAWDQPPPTGAAPGPVLFPLLYAAKPLITTAVFHQLLDAVAEAGRRDSRVLLLALPTARGGPHPHASALTARAAAVFTAHGFPVEAAGTIAERATAAHLVARACATSFTRRPVDLPDLLLAAAADSIGAAGIFVSAGLIPGAQLRSWPLLVPLSHLHHPDDPFAEPPAGAKKAPAGSDALWATALTLGLTGSADPDDDRHNYTAALGRRVGPLWTRLRHEALTGQHTPRCASTGVPRVRVREHPRGTPVAVPLFGAPLIAAGTRTLVAAAALAGPPTLVVDDFTPRFCYRAYPVDDTRARYRTLAADHGGQVLFLTDLPDLADRLDRALDLLTRTDLVAAAGPRAGRRRGALTGFDAVHLAVMGICCTATPEIPTLAVKAINAPHIHALAPLRPPDRLLTCTGAGDLADGELHVPAHWIVPTPGVRL